MAQSQTNLVDTKTLVQEGLKNAISYTDYRLLVSNLVEQEKSTGSTQTEALSNYTMLNDRRMKRFDKTVKIDDDALIELNSIDKEVTLLVLTESWCGDAAPALPVMNKIAELNDRVDLKVILRDEHLDLMNRFLTNGGMSIPKLILWDEKKQEVLESWGPRPEPAAKLVADHKEKHGELLPEIKEEIQHWYNKDKGKSILKELTSLLLK